MLRDGQKGTAKVTEQRERQSGKEKRAQSVSLYM